MQFPARRLLSAAVALGAAAAAASMVYATPARADDPCSKVSGPSIQVQVVGDNTASDTFSAQQMCQGLSNGLYDVHGAQYLLRYTTNPKVPLSNADTSSDVMSLQNLLAHVSIDGSPLPLGTVQFVEVVDHSLNSHYLSKDEVQQPGSVFGSLVPAFWYEPSGNVTAFIRPLLVDDPDDLNYVDNVINHGDPLRVIVHTKGTVLHPTVNADRSKIDFGGKVTFTSTVPDAPPGLRYAWDFGDGTQIPPGTQADVSHVFDKGTCNPCTVRLTVTAPDTSQGSFPLRIQVGTAPPSTPVSPGSTGPTSPGTTGPTSPGTTGPTSPATETGTATGAATGNPSGPASTGPTSRTGQANGPEGSPSDGPTNGASVGPSSAPSKSDGPGGSGGRVVAGQLLLASQVYDVPKDPAVATEASATGGPLPQDVSRSWKWLGVLVIPLLLGLGMAGESMQLRRRLAKMGSVNSTRNRWRRGDHA